MKGVAVLVLLLAPVALHAAPPLSAELRLSSDEVFLHQQLVVSLEIVHAADLRPRWQEPAFEGFWTERLRAQAALVEGDDPAGLRRTVFRRALFPSRSGTLDIPPSRVTAEGPARFEHLLDIPGARIVARPLPVEGRPADFAGVVGRLQIHVSLDHAEVELGRSLQVKVSVFGEANVWDAPPLRFEQLLGDDFEVFPVPARLVKSEHQGTLRGRRIFAADLVPKSTGGFAVPALAIPYFDTETRRYEIARAEAAAFRILPRRRRANREPWQERRALAEPIAASDLLLRGLLALAALVATIFALRWSARRGERRLGRPPVPRPGVLLERAREARGSDGFPVLLRDALKAGIQTRHGFDPSSLTTEEIAARIDDSDALDLLRTLDRMRFTTSAASPESLLSRVSEYVTRA